MPVVLRVLPGSFLFTDRRHLFYLRILLLHHKPLLPVLLAPFYPEKKKKKARLLCHAACRCAASPASCVLSNSLVAPPCLMVATCPHGYQFMHAAPCRQHNAMAHIHMVLLYLHRAAALFTALLMATPTTGMASHTGFTLQHAPRAAHCYLDLHHACSSHTASWEGGRPLPSLPSCLVCLQHIFFSPPTSPFC